MESTRSKSLTVVVGVPSQFQWFQRFASCFNNMVNYFHGHQVEQYKTQKLLTNISVGSILPKQRMEILRQAKEENADFLLWLDSDHTFPKSMIHRLIHGMLTRELDVLAANCATKSMPSHPTARYRPKADATVGTGEECFTSPSSPEYEKVWRVGTGVMMVGRKVIEALPEDCFAMFYRPEVRSYQGEDWTMAEKMEELGFEIWIDHKLSSYVGHLGVFEYTHDYVIGAEQRYKAAEEKKRVVSADA